MSIFAMDIGGTFIKHARFDATGNIISGPNRTPIDEHAAAEIIVDVFSELIAANKSDVIGVCAPGPFDYRRGISLMQHKFAKIRGISLGKAFQAAAPRSNIFFLHDVSAFLLGEIADGKAADCQNAAAVTLGTGLGFTVVHEGKLCLNERDTPERPLWNQPYRGGIAEDYVSRRGIRARYQALGGDEADVKEIAMRADEGEKRARLVLRETGDMVAELLELRMDMGFERVVVGGQIAYAFRHIFPCATGSYPVPILPAMHIADAALRGIAFHAQKSGGDMRKGECFSAFYSI